MKQLPDADWRTQTGLVAVVAALSEDDGTPLCRFVGGAVRDSLIGAPVIDVDLATPLLPGAVIARLEGAGLKAVPTGIDHGTVTAVADGKGFEITTLRRDLATDGRRATVNFADDWPDDAARRDFTINALYADPTTGQIFDYFGGLEDLADRRVRFIGLPAQRIAEDHLRILRYFRFLARFEDGEPQADALAACRDAAASLKSLSRERIAGELMKILAVASPAASVALMQEHGIFSAFLPELRADAPALLTRLAMREQTAAIASDPIRRLLCLIGPEADAAEAIAGRLKLSKRVRRQLLDTIACAGPDPATMRAFAYRFSPQNTRDAALLWAAENVLGETLATLQGWQVPVFPLQGRQVIALGIAPGPEVARTLKAVERRWIEEGFPGPDRVAELARQAAQAD